jgi:hypothetical protein
MEAPNRHPWWSYLRLSTRALLVLVLLLACWLAWVVRATRHQRDAVAAVKKAGGFVQYDWEWKDGDYVQGPRRSPGPRWLVDRIGIDYVSSVTFVNLMHGSDGDLLHVGNLSRLERLNLHGAPVTDVGLASLQGLAHLQVLDLDETQVTDDGLIYLKGMASLKCLGLSKTGVTDVGLDHLKGLQSLRELILYDGRITAAGIAEFRQSHPRVQVRSR